LSGHIGGFLTGFAPGFRPTLQLWCLHLGVHRPLPSRRVVGVEKGIGGGVAPAPDRQNGATLLTPDGRRPSRGPPRAPPADQLRRRAARRAAAARAAVSARRMWGPSPRRAQGFSPSLSFRVSPPSGPTTTRISPPGASPRTSARSPPRSATTTAGWPARSASG